MLFVAVACSAAWYGYLNRMYDSSTSGDSSQDEGSSNLCFDNNAPDKFEDANATSLCMVWTDEEVCLEEHDIPCVATVGVCAGLCA